MNEKEIRAIIRKERNSTNDEINVAFELRDIAHERWKEDFEKRINESLLRITQHLEGEFLRRQHYFERHFEKEIKERRRWFPKWWK